MPEEVMIIIIVAIIATAVVIKAGLRHGRPLELPDLGGGNSNRQENERLRTEVQELKDRIKVIERITVEKENSLGREIDALRDR
ncbi:MAG: hypothetical protein ABIO43_06945 [Sphingomicrobium sp.]